jgi:hypothetical protein
MAGNQFQ